MTRIIQVTAAAFARRRPLLWIGLLALLTASSVAAVTAAAPPWTVEQAAEARDQRRIADLLDARVALFAYRIQGGEYPTELAALVPSHATQVPRDPLAGMSHGATECAAALEGPAYAYRYVQQTGGKGFVLYACLESARPRLFEVRSHD